MAFDISGLAVGDVDERLSAVCQIRVVVNDRGRHDSRVLCQRDHTLIPVNVAVGELTRSLRYCALTQRCRRPHGNGSASLPMHSSYSPCNCRPRPRSNTSAGDSLQRPKEFYSCQRLRGPFPSIATARNSHCFCRTHQCIQKAQSQYWMSLVESDGSRLRLHLPQRDFRETSSSPSLLRRK